MISKVKMTIIDLLYKISLNEDIPEKILYKGQQYDYVEEEKDYVNIFNGCLFDEYVITDILNDEVEILEATITMKADQSSTEVTNKIEYLDNFYTDYIFGCSIDFDKVKDKINEIIDVLNEKCQK